MSEILRLLVTPGFRTGVYAGNAIWHSMAFLNFTFRPQLMIEKLTNPTLTASKRTGAGDEYTQGKRIIIKLFIELSLLNYLSFMNIDIMRYLGGINGGYAILALLRFIPLAISLSSKDNRQNPLLTNQHQFNVNSDILCLTALGLANLSQAALNFFYARQSGRWIVGHWRGLKTDRITILDSLFTVLDFSIVGARLAGY